MQARGDLLIVHRLLDFLKFNYFDFYRSVCKEIVHRRVEGYPRHFYEMPGRTSCRDFLNGMRSMSITKKFNVFMQHEGSMQEKINKLKNRLECYSNLILSYIVAYYR